MRTYRYLDYKRGAVMRTEYGPISHAPVKVRVPVLVFECDADGILEADAKLLAKTGIVASKEPEIGCSSMLTLPWIDGDCKHCVSNRLASYSKTMFRAIKSKAARIPHDAAT